MEDRREQAYQHNLRGCSLMGEGDQPGALEEFSRAIELDPTGPSYVSNRGLARYHMGDYEGAEEDLRQAIRLGPGYSPARAILGDTLYALGRYEEAEASYQAALELKDKDAPEIESMILKCRKALKEGRGQPGVVIHRGLVKTRMSEKYFLGCLAAWAILIIVALLVIWRTGILDTSGRSERVLEKYSEAMWQEARRLVRNELRGVDSLAFPEEPTFTPVEYGSNQLSLGSVVEYLGTGGEKVRRRFRYEAYYGDDEQIHGGAISFSDEPRGDARPIPYDAPAAQEATRGRVCVALQEWRVACGAVSNR